MSDALLFSVDDGIATLTINRPAQRNAINIEVNSRLYEAWETIDSRPDIRVVILTSADCGTFCAGMDLKEAARVREETGEDVVRSFKDPFQARMRRVKVPIVAAMTGHLMAGGMMLSLNCDLRVGLAGTKAGITESKVGRGSPWGVPLVWMLPQPVLMELMLTGNLMPIERLRELGFVNDLGETPDAVRAKALALARAIRDNAPLSVACAKQSILAAMSVGCDAGLEMAWRIHRPAYESEDAEEGPRAFAEGRKPVWLGR
ncbi:enoyl-CoA hydratase/isomerase [Bordetella pertussis]|uniref:Enoyl-CoA hydratase/isomerase n=3 Tax=Bordetella pertussis TaxID=520 RepID=Q7VSS7_BORPE|nr:MULTISPECIES: enoyl-CoA hydratase-related protein [Bordetella]ETH41258.1 enoyl-CoA hydratase/isomerase family protein [Bordetella pertussis H918]ETH42190.1 enoyl-CoA hydratase/isomerase family protein [Bordetella pertussis H939]ETH48759.1 enoyl-CoA hydratase/isomerase family protein [Bordetella pertussis H921]ETH73340.1 enoyl-CoA hydratase/isomerase family protein [Bordetella pertussis STO1-CHLA-0011]ETH82320.1 enoyl-CoA hydratase/isomerase family protein [Bordetella pertussis STO1-CHOC-001